MKSLMKTKKVGRYYDGGEVSSMPEDGADLRRDDELMPAKPQTASAPVRKAPSKPAAPKSSPAAAPAAPQRVEVVAKRYPKDDESKSVSARAKDTLTRARMGSADTDSRSVTSRMGGSERQGSSTTTDTRSLAERAKASRDSARSSGTGTDSRPVGERVRSAFGFADGGLVKRGALKSHGKAC
jgi:hypothetical protein